MAGSHNTHARLSPSDSHRWTTCTNAISYERMFKLASAKTPLTQEERTELMELLHKFDTPLEDARSVGYSERDETAYNMEGTKAHDFAEKVLLGEMELADVPDDFRDAVGTYVYECQTIAEETDGMEPFIEAEVPLYYDKHETGTMDFAVVSQALVRVRDYKHGQGIYVDADENTQLAIYALSTMTMLEDEQLYTFTPDTTVEIGLVQPRHREWVQGDVWTLTYHDLKSFCETHITPAREAIISGEGCEFKPSYKACLFCRLKAFCGASRHALSDGLPTMDPEGRTEADFLEGLPTYDERGSEQKFEEAHPDELDRIKVYTANYGTISMEQMVKIYSNRKGITAFLRDIEKHLTKLALEGRAAEGTKLVMGRQGNTEWTDEAAAEKLLENQKLRKEERCVIKVVSPSKAAEILGDKVNEKKKNNPFYSPRLAAAYKALLHRSPGKKTLALAGDKRPAVESNLDGLDDESVLDEIEDNE